MSDIIGVPLFPGGMLSDVVEDEYGQFQWQRVVNLRQLKRGEFELAPGYRNVTSISLFTDAKAGIEVTEDLSGDRFLLFQDGINIKRIDHDIINSPVNGYENETATTLSLPTSITISTSTTLKFFYFRGVVRISGASAPLWYGYVDRTLFEGDNEFTHIGWKLERAALFWTDNDLEVVTVNPIPHEEIDTSQPIVNPFFALFMQFFYVFDKGQFQLLRNPDTSAITDTVFGFVEEIFPEGGSYGAQLQLRIPGGALENNMFNGRITGVGIAFATVPYGLGGTEAAEQNKVYKGRSEEPFFVRDILLIDKPTETQKVGFSLEAADWNDGSPFQLEISDPADTWGGPNIVAVFLPAEAGFMGPGVKVKISLGSLSIDTTVASVTFGDFGTTRGILTLDDDISSVLGVTGLKFNVGIVVTREWQYSAVNGYHTFFGLDLLALGTFYEDFAQIPAGTKQNTPNWDIIEFLTERAFCAGQTGDIGSSLVSGGTIQTVTIVEDTMDDTNGVLLTAHTMNLGNGWISGDGVATIFEIQSNEAADSSGNLGETLYTESNRSDKIKITGRMVLNGANDAVSIKFRYIDENNFWTLNYIGSTLPFVSLVRFVGGVATTRDTEAHTISDGVSVTFEIELVGNIITAKILTPETHTLTTTDSAHQSATRHGFASDNANAALVIVDNFKITEDILVPTSSAIANDVFNDTNGVALTAHTMNLGNGWTSAGAQWEIQSNEARDSGAGSGVQVITELNKSDKLIITGKIMINDPLDETRISFRHFTINDEWLFSYSGSNTPTFEIRRVIASVTTVQATQAHTVADGTFVSFQITLDGSSIELKILSPEVYTLQVTDSTHITETKLAFFPLATNAGITRIDDLGVVEIVQSFIIASSEQDTVRHTPPGQIDNFPISNVIQTEVGDTDKILNLKKRDQQLTVLKKKSISVGSFVGTDYTENVSISKHGLFSPIGAFSATLKIRSEDTNEFLMIVDQDDMYLFNGINAVSFFESVLLREFYKAKVTNISFILLDKINGELMFFLGNEILVWRMHTSEFYIRKTDITPLFGFLDADNKLIIGTSTKFVTYNHDLGVPYDEDMSLFLRAKVTDNNTPHRLKKLKALHSYLSSSSDIKVDFSDVQGAVPGVQIVNTRGVLDHWIAECQYIVTLSGDPCYGALSTWANTQSGREQQILITSGGSMNMEVDGLNGLDVITIPDPVVRTLLLLDSSSNPVYNYMHSAQAWFVIIWEQVTPTFPISSGTLWGNGNFLSEIAGFTIFVWNELHGTPLSLGLQVPRAVSTAYIDIDTGVNQVIMGNWNYAILSWEDGAGRDGCRINLNGTNIDFSNTIFNGSPTSNSSVRDIILGVRAGPQSPRLDTSMKIVELAAGNVGLTNAEMLDMENYIKTKYAIPLGQIPLKSKTISSPTNLKPRIENNCNYLFKELQVEFSNVTDSASLTAQIRDFLLRIERWQKN